jgi:hypothetical protein
MQKQPNNAAKTSGVPDCQSVRLPAMSEGEIKVKPDSLRGRFALVLHRSFSPSRKRKLKGLANTVFAWVDKARRQERSETDVTVTPTSVNLQPGDLVRVMSKEQIEATLDPWKALKGCGFMKEMWPYCGTTQKVHKLVTRFLDERDYRLKKTKGIVLLEGVYCQGTEKFGPCDRSCFFFWRQEWLEKIE